MFQGQLARVTQMLQPTHSVNVQKLKSPCLHHKYATVWFWLQTQGCLLLSSVSALLPFSARQRLNHLSTQPL